MAPMSFFDGPPAVGPAPNVDANNVTGPETGLVVKFNPASGHWEDRLGRRGHERFAGRMGVLNPERAFFECPSPVGEDIEQRGPGNPPQNPFVG